MIEYYNEDCMVGMARYPDKYFDLAIVDPPYGVSLSGGRGNNGWTSKQFWDKARDGWNKAVPNQEYFSELQRVSVNQIIWGGNYFALPPSKCWLIWDKGQRDFSLADAEMAWASFDKAVRIFDYPRGSANCEQKYHPTQKPVALYKWLLKNYAKQGDLILDTHVGSASSLIACHDMGFDAVGFELDADYYKASKQRLDDFMAQPKLDELVVEQREQIGLEEV